MGIINDILDFSKIEAGRMELDVHSYSLPELLSDLQLMIEMRAAEKNLSFSMDVDQRIPVMPIGDMQKLKQVILNLLTNAVKYTEEGYVRLTLKLLSIEEDNFLMEISVEDTGIGIKDQEMRKLYSAFDRLDMENNRNIEGSGLGLAISENLLSLMNSKMQVKSQYGKGSCFSFVISQGISDRTEIGLFEPVKNEAGRKYDRRKATFTAPNAKILVVDDTPMNLQVICGLLKDNKMIIDTAESGKECVDLVGDNEYDVIFLDQRMPNMDGVETLNTLKLKYPEKISKTIIISLTANALTGVREEMLEAGFTDYLTKPVKLSNMENMLLKYLPKEKIQRNCTM
jgi:CheY-like chemotaxis protein